MESDGTIESQLFPILLLLSRIQPVAKCNDSSIEISNQYHNTLLRCLGSKDSSIRDVAARALAVMCCRTTTGIMITKLCVMVNGALRKSGRLDYNLVDGCLLALEKLVPSYNVENCSRNSHIIDQNSELSSLLHHIVRDPCCPPTCRATAIRIVKGRDKSFISLYERLIAEGPTNVDNGYTYFQAQIAEALCNFYRDNLLNVAFGEHQLLDSLRGLKCLFLSDEIDIRLASIKSFKKGLPGHIQKLNYVQQPSLDSRVSYEVVVESLGAMLIDCVSAESTRLSILGGHPPSLRRLSRCFLDVIDACSTSSFGNILLPKNDLLWTTSCEIVKGLKGRERSEPDGSTSLAANVVEMMAVHFLIAHNKNGIISPERVEGMISIIEELNHPLSSWRARYSAATALEWCHPIWSKAKADTNFISLHRRSLVCILILLQDSDPDVRRAAVRAATKYSIKIMDGSDTLVSSASSNARSSLLPEWTLKTFFPLVFNLSDDARASKTFNDLLAIVFDGSRGILDIIRTLQSEFRHSSVVAKGDSPCYVEQLINNNSHRAIFEIEDPNPHLERLLVSQLAARTVLDNAVIVDSLLSSTTGPSTDILDLFILCNDVLDQLKNTLNEGGMIHDLSRFPSLFPSLHGLLCFVAALTCSRGGADPKKWDDDQGSSSSSPSVIIRQVMESAAFIVKQGKYVHPEIKTVLRVISGQEQSDEALVDQNAMTFLIRNK